jgi:DNA-binding CsgD family transcriptional regulator/putative methionine-R-sulfoxide reductase with GAF domain
MGIKATIQSLQDGYAQLLDLMLVLVDDNKVPITDPSLPKGMSDTAFYKPMMDSVPSLSKVKAAIFIDFLPGLKVIVSPIQVDKENTIYYLVGGIVIAKSSLEAVKRFLQNHPKGIEFHQHFHTFLALSTEEKEHKLSVVQQLSETIEALYHAQQGKELHQKQLSQTGKIAKELTSNSFTLDLLIQYFRDLHSKMDFVGLAVRTENERYVIKHFLGETKESVVGTEISIGEGFLGQAMVSEEYSYWRNIQEDPRTLPYKENGLSPVSIFCYPIKVGNEIKGMLFGGSNQENEFDSEDIPIIASLIGIFMNQQHLQESLNNHLLQLSTFNEIFNVMTNVKNIKRVLYILIDMGMNILTGSFASVVYKEAQEKSKLSIISRGMKNDFLSSYGKDVGKRFFSNQTDARKAQFRVLDDEKLVYELPITYRDSLYGVLSIGIRSKEEVSLYSPFLSSLAVAGGISIFLLHKETGGQESDEKIIQLLAALLERNQPNEFEQTVRAQHLIFEFGKEIELPSEQIEALMKASTLYFYEQETVMPYIQEPECRTLMQYLFQAKDGLHEVDYLPAKLLLIVYSHLGESSYSSIKNDPLYQRFEQWLSRIYTVESEIVLDDEVQLEEKEEVGLEKHEIKDKLHLSNREMEVLQQVLKGLNNREIASSLFISDHTVKNHMTNILQKLGVTDRSQAIAKVYQMGYIPR